MAIKAKKKKRKPSHEMTLWGVVLSFPDLHDPKPFRNKVTYKTDVLLEKGHPQLSDLKKAVKDVYTEAFGDDESEWPETKYPHIRNGNERADQPAYEDKRFIVATSNQPVPVVDLKGRAFNAQSVKGGMFANVAIRISVWEFEGAEGVSIYLQGVQIDTTKAALNFGSGKSVSDMFKKGGKSEDDSDDEDQDDDNDQDAEDDEDDQPKSKKKKPARSRDEDEEDEEDEDQDDEDEDEAPKSKKKNRRNFDDEDDE